MPAAGRCEQLLGGAGLDHHHAHAVRDDVVQFPRDSGAFPGEDGRLLLFALALEAFRALGHLGCLARPALHQPPESATPR